MGAIGGALSAKGARGGIGVYMPLNARTGNQAGLAMSNLGAITSR